MKTFFMSLFRKVYAKGFKAELETNTGILNSKSPQSALGLRKSITEQHLLHKYRDLHSKKDRDKNSLFALEKPADWSYDFFH